MILFNLIRIEQATDEIEERGGFPEDWTIDSLTGLHTVASSMLHENKDHIKDEWSITFAEVCRIIRQERAQAEFEQNWEQWRRLKAKA